MQTSPHSGGAGAAFSGAGAQLVVRSSLRSAVRSPANRRRAQGLVWDWVGAKWPRLMPSPQDMERSHLERALAAFVQAGRELELIK